MWNPLAVQPRDGKFDDPVLVSNFTVTLPAWSYVIGSVARAPPTTVLFFWTSVLPSSSTHSSLWMFTV